MPFSRAWRRDRASAVAVLALAAAPFVIFWRGTLGQVLLAPADGLLYSFPVRLLAARTVLQGEWPWWNPYAFSGFPLFAEMQTAVLYPGAWLFYLLPPVAAMNLQMLATYSVAAVGTFAFTRAIGCTRFAASFAGLTFSLGGFMVAHLAHVATPQGAAWLPWLLWAVERLRNTVRLRFVVVEALALALAVLAGHPPIPMYLLMVAGLYVAVFALADVPPVGRLRYLALCAGAVLAGLALTAVQLLPAAELASQSVRSQLSFAEFTSYSLPRLQLPLLLFPYLFGGAAQLFGGGPPTHYWGAWNLAELTGYVGAAPLILAAAALAELRSNRQVAVWTGVAVFSFLLVLGDGTPLASVMFHVPVYKLFRAQARNFLEFDFALAVLSALALSARRPRALHAAAALVLGGAIVFALVAAAAGERIWGNFAAMRFSPALGVELLTATTALSSRAVLLPLAFTAAAGAALIAFARTVHPAVRGAVLAVQAIDLFVFGTLMGQPTPEAASVLTPPARVRALQAALEATPGRVGRLSAVTYPDDYRWALWGLRLVGGYDPFMLSRYGELAGHMPYWGQFSADAVVQHPLFLDLLDARVLIVDNGIFANPRTLLGLGIILAPGESVEFVREQPRTASALEVVSYLGDGAAIAQAAPVARITLWDTGGGMTELLMRAGEHTAEWSIDALEVAGRMRHRRAAIAENAPGAPYGGHTYRAVLALPHPRDVARLRVEYLQGSGALSIQRIALGDGASEAWAALSVIDAMRAEPGRWVVRQEAPDFTLVENRRALSRAWLVGETVALRGAAALAAVRSERLPDGRPFDPTAIALVEDGASRDRGRVDPAARVEVIAATTNALQLSVSSPTPAFLVLSEVDYPGWRATVDGRAEPIVRTNYVLRGLEVPAGTHRVRVELRPRSVYLGAAVSAGCIALLAGLAVWRLRRRNTVEGAAPSAPGWGGG
jgi:hypothetical protein